MTRNAQQEEVQKIVRLRSSSKKERLRLAVTILTILTLSLWMSTGLIQQARADDLSPHSPISINGNAEFTNANGVSSGSGTPGDPYIIQDWKIVFTQGSSPPAGMEIKNTDAFFMIRDVLSNACNPITCVTGISLVNVYNGVVQDSVTSGAPYALVIQLSKNIVLSKDTLGSAGTGLSIASSDSITIKDSSVGGSNGLLGHSINSLTITGSSVEGEEGMEVSDVHQVQISNSTFLGGDFGSLDIGGCTDAKLMRDSVTGPGGLVIADCTNVLISRSDVSNAPAQQEFGLGITVRDSSQVIVRRNTVSNDLAGITLQGSNSVLVEHNNITENGFGPPLPFRTCPPLDPSSTPAGCGGIVLSAGTAGNTMSHNLIVLDKCGVTGPAATIQANTFFHNTFQNDIQDFCS